MRLVLSTLLGSLMLLLLLAAGYQLWRWSAAKQKDPKATFLLPRLELAWIGIKDYDPQRMNVELRLVIDDPAPVGGRVSGIVFTFSIAGVVVTESSYPGAFELNAYDITMIVTQLAVEQALLVSTLQDLRVRAVDSVDHRLEITMRTDLPFGQHLPLHIDITKHLPLFPGPRSEGGTLTLGQAGAGANPAIGGSRGDQR